jgi:hypothetical protein
MASTAVDHSVILAVSGLSTERRQVDRGVIRSPWGTRTTAASAVQAERHAPRVPAQRAEDITRLEDPAGGDAAVPLAVIAEAVWVLSVRQ